VRNYTASKLFGSNWCWIADIFLTVDFSNINVHKLEKLAELFNLSGSLMKNVTT
jgi:hypothetical protein